MTDHRLKLPRDGAQLALQVIIFDCDGVLIDSEVLAAQVHCQALTQLGYAISAKEMIRRFTGIPDREMYQIIEHEMRRKLPEDYDESTKAALARSYISDVKPILHIHDVLEQIDLLMCVASSSTPEKLRRGLELVGLHDRFAPYIFSATQVRHGKPAPDLFLFAAHQMDVEPGSCLVVEDSVAGVKAAVAAGMEVLGFTGGGHCDPGHDDVLKTAGAGIAFSDMRNLPGLVADRMAARHSN